MKEELDLEEKTDVELVGVPTEEAAGSPGAEEAEPGGGLSEGDGVVPGDEEKAGPGELSPIKAFTESEGVPVGIDFTLYVFCHHLYHEPLFRRAGDD